MSTSQARQPGSCSTQCIVVKATWRVQGDLLEGPQPGPPAWNPLASAFADTTYIRYVIAILILDSMTSMLLLTSPLHYVTNRENFGRLSMTFREHRLTECTLLLTDSCNAFSQ